MGEPYAYIEKKGDSSTRLNFSYAFLGTKIVPESNVALNFTDGGTPIAIEQGAKMNRGILRANLPTVNGSAYEKSHTFGEEATYPRLLNFLDNVVNWAFNDITFYMDDNETLRPVDCRITTQSIPKSEVGAFWYDLTLEMEYVRVVP